MSKLLPLNDPYKMKLADKLKDMIIMTPTNHKPLFIPKQNLGAKNGK